MCHKQIVMSVTACGLLVLFLPLTAPPTADDKTVANDSLPSHRGVWEVSFQTTEQILSPSMDWQTQLIFTRPDQSVVQVDCFFRGDKTWIGRAYCDQPGQWSWRTVSAHVSLNHIAGQFEVLPSELPGKLRKHPDDSHQFVFDNGQWFLHLGDTGYRCLTDTEPLWQQYLDEAAAVGFTKIRAWFCRSRSGVEALLTHDRSGVDLEYWDEMDRRIQYALEKYPFLQLQLILYGEDREEVRRYAENDSASQLVARYAQARFAAYPNIQWCISNDLDITAVMRNRAIHPEIIDRIGTDLRAREPWGTLLTNHQRRFSGYAFATSDWSDIVTLEEMDQVTGEALLKYRSLCDDPVVNDEDRYGIYRSPKHDRYFFRRLMWASLLSGGHATYGGLETYEAFDSIDGTKGVHGYRTAVNDGRLDDGAHDFQWIHQFFRDTRMTLAGFEPADEIAGGNAALAKASSDGRNVIIYLQNPDVSTPETADVRESHAQITPMLPPGTWKLRWFDPRSGRWHDASQPYITSSEFRGELISPFTGDSILLLQPGSEPSD